MSVLVLWILSRISSVALLCLREVFHEKKTNKKTGEAASEIASSLCESDIHHGRILTVLFLSSLARVSMNAGKI